jgi:hypothetical protein
MEAEQEEQEESRFIGIAQFSIAPQSKSNSPDELTKAISRLKELSKANGK